MRIVVLAITVGTLTTLAFNSLIADYRTALDYSRGADPGGFETKGPAVLLAAMPLLVRHMERLCLIITGDGESRFLDSFRKTGALVLGYVPFDSMPGLIEAADLTLVPSIWFDNSPITICESLRVGTPVIGRTTIRIRRHRQRVAL